MPEITSPREVVERLLDRLSHGRWDELAELYADDFVGEAPFAIPEPARVKGREQLRAAFSQTPGRRLDMRVRNLVVYETSDPEVVVAEYDYDGRAIDTDRTFHLANVLVARVCDGVIVSSRDYHNHLAMAMAVATGHRPPARGPRHPRRPRVKQPAASTSPHCCQRPRGQDLHTLDGQYIAAARPACTPLNRVVKISPYWKRATTFTADDETLADYDHVVTHVNWHAEHEEDQASRHDQ